MIERVFPGVELVFARLFLFEILLINEDLPTLDLPQRISWGKSDFGKSSSSNTDFMKWISLNIINKKRVTENPITLIIQKIN